jgi:hypothetical protein
VTRFGDFLPTGLLLDDNCDLLIEVAQRNSDVLGYFLLKQILYFFEKRSSFKTFFAVSVQVSKGVKCRYYGV